MKTFTEKPELSLAKKFLESGDFVWNSGIFIWGVEAINKAFHQYLPEMSEVFDEIKTKLGTPEEKEAIRKCLFAMQKYFHRLWHHGESKKRLCLPWQFYVV